MRDSPDLERLVSELNETHDVAATGQLDAWLRTLVSRGGSDLLLVSGVPAAIRVEGVITPITDEPLTGAAIDAAVLPALHPHAARLYREQHVADASYSIPAIGRFRINLHRQRGVAAAAIRALPSRVPELSQLGLPPGVEALSRLPRGLVLIGGPAGSGKTTTLAALIHEINRR
jgi:twitching motility protein PilT